MNAALNARIRDSLAYVPGFPVTRFNFPDITPLLENNPKLFHDIVEELLRLTDDWNYNTVLCVESFGYIFGVPIAYKRGCNITLMRRPGKLPRPKLSQDYSMCYDAERRMEIHEGALTVESRTLVIDDFLVSGGTAEAALRLIAKAGASAVGVACVVENPSWNARELLSKYNVPIVSLARIGPEA
jgi:adenine phosphoribosyltransferase